MNDLIGRLTVYIVDQCPDNEEKTLIENCGCAVHDTDTDSDGAEDCNESCDEDPAKIESGLCGCGVADSDVDGDGFIDCSGAGKPEVTNDTNPLQAPIAEDAKKKKKQYSLKLNFEPLGKADKDVFGKGKFKVFYQVMYTVARAGKSDRTRMKISGKASYIIRKLKEGDVVTYKYRILVKKKKKNKKTGEVRFKTVYTSEYSPEGTETIVAVMG